MTNDQNQEQESQQLLADLLVLSKLSSDSVQELGDRLEHHTGFVSVEALAAEAYSEDAVAGPVVRLILGLIPESLNHVIDMVSYWRQSDERAKELLNDERFAMLKENLPLLVRKSPALTRSRKAGGLQTVTGNELMGVMFICDARPVYNNARDDIDGYVPLATMKLVYQRQNADTDEIEFVMTPAEIDLLIDRAEKAKAKIAVMNTKIAPWLPKGIVGDET